MDQIFSAFFTTKPQGQRHGIGHQPFHCGIAWRPVVGGCQRWTRSNISLHLADLNEVITFGCINAFLSLLVRDDLAARRN